MRALVFGLIMLLSACASTTGELRYAGVYAEGMEVVTFHADGQEEVWSAAGTAAVLQELQAAAPPRNNPWDGFWVRAIVTGQLSQPGRYGHLGQFRRELTITDVIMVQTPAPSQ